jgi:hypothetical protein
MKKVFFGLIAMVFLSLNSFAQTENRKGGPEGFGSYTVKGFLLLADHGCYTILINVYQEVNGTIIIVASSTVCVGVEGCRKANVNSNDEICSDFELDGDYFYHSKTEFKYCLQEIFKDSSTYLEYQNVKKDILTSLKN